jgi:hypothetical protein
VPVGDGSHGDPTQDYDGSGQCYLTGNGPGNTDVDGGPTRLISPALDLSDAEQPVATFACWIACDDPMPPAQDSLKVAVSADDGATWIPVETIAHTSAWVTRELPLLDYITPSESVRLMFSVTDNPNNSITEAGVDAVRVYDLKCASSPPLCAGDLNCDGLVDFDDIDPFVAALGCPGGDPNCWESACPWLNGDCDGDEDVTLDDIDPFVARIGATCD